MSGYLDRTNAHLLARALSTLTELEDRHRDEGGERAAWVGALLALRNRLAHQAPDGPVDDELLDEVRSFIEKFASTSMNSSETEALRQQTSPGEIWSAVLDRRPDLAKGKRQDDQLAESCSESLTAARVASLDDLLTVAEVAAHMRVSKMTVYRLVHSGELTAVRVGRSFRVPHATVHDYLSQWGSEQDGSA